MSLIKEIDFTDKQKELYQTMSDISEDCYFAGWMMGNEYTIWNAILTGDLRYGIWDIEKYALDKCKELSEELKGWIIWVDDDDDPNLPVEEWGARFIPMDEWLVKYNRENVVTPLSEQTK